LKGEQAAGEEDGVEGEEGDVHEGGTGGGRGSVRGLGEFGLWGFDELRVRGRLEGRQSARIDA
jgi:hypothetical protein